MSLFDDEEDTPYGLFDDAEDATTVDPETEDKINTILSKHDPDGSISSQVCEHLQRDELKLELLCEFDDFSLKEVIDSWNLDTFNQKPFIIRGLLINGIKKLRKTGNKTTETNTSQAAKPQSNTKTVPPKVPPKPPKTPKTTKTEKKEESVIDSIGKERDGMVEELSKHEKILDVKISKLEQERLQRNRSKQKLLTQYSKDIESVFNELRGKLDSRKQYLLKEVNNIFDNNIEKGDNYLFKLQHLKTEIKNDVTKVKNAKDLTSMKNIVDTKDTGNKVNELVDNEVNVSYECNISLPKDIIQDINDKIDKLGTVSDANSAASAQTTEKPAKTPQTAQKKAKNAKNTVKTEAKTPEAAATTTTTAAGAGAAKKNVFIGSVGSSAGSKPIWKTHVSTKPRSSSVQSATHAKTVKTDTNATIHASSKTPATTTVKGAKKPKTKQSTYQPDWMKKSKFAMSRELGNDDESGSDSDNNNNNENNSDDWMHNGATTSTKGTYVSKTAKKTASSSSISSSSNSSIRMKSNSVSGGSGTSGPSWLKKNDSSKENASDKTETKEGKKRVSGKGKPPPVLKNLW